MLRIFQRSPAAASPTSAGLLATVIPACSQAAIFSFAVPFTPEIIEPACPILLPGGAVCPAINPTTGFFSCSFTNAPASSSAVPPISPITMISSVSGSY